METYHRKVERRQLPSLQMAAQQMCEVVDKITLKRKEA